VGVAGALVVLIAVGGVGWTIGDWLLAVSVFGFSLEHPTANEQTIKIAANTSGLAVVPRLIFPHAIESKIAGVRRFGVLSTNVLRTGVARNRLIRVTVGHLLLLSSDNETARRRPRAAALILRGLANCTSHAMWWLGHDVARATRR